MSTPKKGCDQEETIGPHAKRLLQRVYKKLQEEASTNEPCNNALRLCRLTGLHAVVLNKFAKGHPINTSTDEIDRYHILKVLHNLCIVHNVIPTTALLFSSCQEILPGHMDFAEFRKLLLKYDFVWKRLKNQSFVVLERPEVTYERYIFLKMVTSDPEERDNTYFIEEFSVDDDYNVYDFCTSMQVNKKTRKIIYAISWTKILSNVKFESDYTQKSFKDWVTDELLPNLSNPSKIIFNKAEHHCEMLPQCTDITIESLRCDMTDWLDRNGVPYDEIMSKCELFALIENCTNKEANKYVIDNLLLASGHTPVRIPDHLISLTPGQDVLHVIEQCLENDVEARSNDGLFKILQAFTSDDLTRFFNRVNDIYCNTFEEDKKLDDILDTLFETTENLGWDKNCDDSDLPSLSEDSD